MQAAIDLISKINFDSNTEVHPLQYVNPHIDLLLLANNVQHSTSMLLFSVCTCHAARETYEYVTHVYNSSLVIILILSRYSHIYLHRVPISFLEFPSVGMFS